MELRYYLTLLRRWAWLLILGGIIGGVGAFIFSWYQPLVFSTTTKAMVMKAPIDAFESHPGKVHAFPSHNYRCLGIPPTGASGARRGGATPKEFSSPP